ncbi:MAG: polyphenol oxidase family protein [Actinomycetota bacterium]|nr:polyphenol oxidase family protein [Actinomycetota bacterium]
MRHDTPSWSYQLQDGRNVCLIFTTKDHGDLSINQELEVLAERQRSIVDQKWAYLTQVHGAEVVEVESAGQHQGRAGDALITSNSNLPLSIQIADCAPVALISPRGSLGLVHAGWKGLISGVIDTAVDAMSRIGKRPTVGVLGPCIHPGFYEFGEREMKDVCNLFGQSVRSETLEGRLALNLPKAVEIALGLNDISEMVNFDECTSNTEKFWSHRLRKDQKRQAMVGWIQ